MLCNDLERWGRGERKEIYAYTSLMHFTVWQKLTQHWKAFILQFKKIIQEVISLGSQTPMWHSSVQYDSVFFLFVLGGVFCGGEDDEEAK